MSKKKKWALAFAIASIIFAPSVAFASVTTSTGTTTPATSTPSYSCNSGDTLSGTICTTPVVHHPATTSLVPAELGLGDWTCDGQGGTKTWGAGYGSGNVWICIDGTGYYGHAHQATSYTCSSGTLDGNQCILAISAYDSVATTYNALQTNSLSCPSGQTLNSDNQCSGTGSTVFNATELGTTLAGWITSHLLVGIAGLLTLAIAIRLTIKAVRKYAKA